MCEVIQLLKNKMVIKTFRIYITNTNIIFKIIQVSFTQEYFFINKGEKIIFLFLKNNKSVDNENKYI